MFTCRCLFCGICRQEVVSGGSVFGTLKWYPSTCLLSLLTGIPSTSPPPCSEVVRLCRSPPPSTDRRRERAVEKRMDRGASATRCRACNPVTITIHKTIREERWVCSFQRQVNDQQESQKKTDISHWPGKFFVALLLSLPLLLHISSKVRTVAFDHGCTTQGKEERQDKRRGEKETIAGYQRTGPDSLTVRASLGLLCTRRPKKESTHKKGKKKSQKASGLMGPSAVVIRVLDRRLQRLACFALFRGF